MVLSVLSELVQKIPIKIVIFKDNRIKQMFPSQPELKQMRIALYETSNYYLSTQNESKQIQRLHFINVPKSFSV